VFYFIEEKLIQGIAELIKRKMLGVVGVRFFYSLLKTRECGKNPGRGEHPVK